MKDDNVTIEEMPVLETVDASEVDTTALESAMAIAKENYEAILKETNSPTTARLVSGYDPEEEGGTQ